MLRFYDLHLGLANASLRNMFRGKNEKPVQPKDMFLLEHPEMYQRKKETDPLALIKRMDAYTAAYNAQFGARDKVAKSG